MRSFLSSALLLGGGVTAAAAQAQCYAAAGMKALDQYVPCSSGSGVSACCLAGDFCLADGACFGPETQMTYIAGCTDPNYSDGSCKGGADTCKKTSQFQGLAMCGSSWVCCQGDGQSGDIPSSNYAKSCPCDAGYGTAIANAGTLAAVNSLGTAFATHPSSPATSASPTSAAGTTSTPSSGSSSSGSSSGGSSSDNSGSSSGSSGAASSTTFQTISASINPNSGITGSGPAAATSSAPAPAPASDSNKSMKIGLGVGIPLGVALVGAIGVALFCFRRRLLKREPQYVTQADLSTPVWVGEAPGSGMPAPRDAAAYSAAAGGGAGAGAKANSSERNSGGSFGPMREVERTPPPQYQGNGNNTTPAGNNAANGSATVPTHPVQRPASQGIWQPQRLQALQ